MSKRARFRFFVDVGGLVAAKSVAARIAGAVALAAALVIGVAGCPRAHDDGSDAAAVPPGFVVVLRAGDACSMFRDVARTPGTEAATIAATAATAACACPAAGLVSAVAADGEPATALGALRCGPLATTKGAHAQTSGALALDEGGAGPVVGGSDGHKRDGGGDIGRIVFPGADAGAPRTGGLVRRGPRAADGTSAVDVVLSPAPGSALAVLAGSPAPTALDDDGALIHLGAATSPSSVAALLDDPRTTRLLPGIGLAATALLDGIWELVVYRAPASSPSTPGALLPVVRAGVRAPAQLVDALAGQAEQRWHLTPERAELAGRSGVCFPDARMVPALGPCVVVDGDAIVVAWNRAAALHGFEGKRPDHAAPLGIHLDRFGDATPWQRIAIEPSTNAVTLHFVPRATTPDATGTP